MSMPIFLYNVGHKFYTSAFESALWFVEMNLETHVFLIPNFFVENKIVGKQKTQVKKFTIVFPNIQTNAYFLDNKRKPFEIYLHRYFSIMLSCILLTWVKIWLHLFIFVCRNESLCFYLCIGLVIRFTIV